MFFWKYKGQIFTLNEYYVFIPMVMVGNYFIIRKIRLDKQRLKEIKDLKKQIERERKIRRIMLVASLGINGWTFLSTRGGAEFIRDFLDVDFIREQCEIPEGLSYLNDRRFVNIIHDLYKNKRKGKMIYITATALCHLVQMYGLHFFSVPFAIQNFGITNLYHGLRKLLVSLLLGGVGPAVIIGGANGFMSAAVLATLGLKCAYANLDVIDTTAIDDGVPAQDLQPRIPGLPDVVVVNDGKKLIMNEPPSIPPGNQECWLMDQRLLNPNCQIRSTDIPEAINQVPDLTYQQTVNMKDVTGLDQLDFSDKYDLGHPKAEPIVSPQRPGKEVNFLDKFGDRRITDGSEAWNVDENQYSLPTPEPGEKTRN